MARWVVLAFVVVIICGIFARAPEVPLPVPAGEIINVPEDYETIQAAITAANNGDTIIVTDGTYHEHDIDLQGKSIHLKSLKSDGGPYACTIDCHSLGRGFILDSGEDENCIIEGFTIRNGSAFDGGARVGPAGSMG